MYLCPRILETTGRKLHICNSFDSITIGGGATSGINNGVESLHVCIFCKNINQSYCLSVNNSFFYYPDMKKLM